MLRPHPAPANDLRTRTFARRLFTLPLLLGAVGCASAGPWGFSRDYTPLDAEEDAASGASEYDPVMIGRKFHEWRGKRVSVFGVVEEVSSAKDGSDELLLSVRVLQDRNLCETAAEDSCRVTVSEHEFSRLHVRLELTPEDRAGEHRLQAGSLVRVIGPISSDAHAETGGTVLVANYHRHWPRKYFVTTADRDYMKR